MGKSACQIRKAIHWATDKSLWPILWPHYPSPNQMHYFYPTSNQASIEFATKWRLFLPSGEFKNHPDYGWREVRKNGDIFSLNFNSGCTIYFKSYKQGATALQASTVYAMWLDEECPDSLWDELQMRKQAVDGYISMVFTATLGQELWRKTFEPRDADEEMFPAAWKRQVSLYDCQFYEDGSPSHWTGARINQVIAGCKSPQEVQRRVFGKFVKDSGLKYPQFNVQRHLKKKVPVPEGWFYYIGADIGSGGAEGHPSAITVVAVRPDYQFGRVVSTWRGDGEQTTASDVYLKAEAMIAELGVAMSGRYYDFGSAEFLAISQRLGGMWQPADKSHETGERVINVLFKNNMLTIDDCEDAGKLVGEFSNLTIGGHKRNKSDDLADSTRYCVTRIPWDWSCLTGGMEFDAKKDATPALSPEAKEIQERRKAFEEKSEEEGLQAEFDEVNDAFEGII